MPFDLSSEIDSVKVAALASLYASQGIHTRFQEVVRVDWAAGTNIRYYANTGVDQLAGFTGITAHGISGVQARLTKLQFLEIPRTSDLGDDQVSFSLWDGDGAIKTLWRLSGEGTKAYVYLYLPDVDLLVETFNGLLKAPDEVTRDKFTIKAASGFRAINLPMPRRIVWVGCSAFFGGAVRPDGSFLFPDAAAIADNDCPYDRHIGGSMGLLNGGSPFTSCPRNAPSACTARLGDTKSYLGFDLYIESEVVGSGDNRFTATSRGNESLQRRPLRVVYGTRVVKDLVLLGYQAQSGGDHPERGYLKSFWLVSEGEISAIYDFYVNGQYVPPNHLWGNLGKLRQDPVLFTTNTLNYSGTAVMRADVGPRDWRNTTGRDLSAQALVVGKKDVKVYSNPTTFTKQYTINRAFCLLDGFTARRYGHGADKSRVDLQGMIDLAGWSDELVWSKDENDSQVQIPRTTFNADVSERTFQQQVNDWCLFGRYTLPFTFNGKLRVLPLRIEPLTDVPTFTDEGSSGRNIIFENGRSTLSARQKSDSEIPNQLKVTFDDASRRYAETTFPFDDFTQQMRAGLAAGDRSIRVVEKSYSMFGITTFAEALRVARMLLHLGEFDKGGIKNNLSVKFQTWSPLVAALKLHPWKLIRVLSSFLSTFEEAPGVTFEYFRVMKMRRLPNLRMEIEAQAYPVNYMAASDSQFTDANGSVTVPNPGSRYIAPPRPVIVRSVTRSQDFLEVTIGE